MFVFVFVCRVCVFVCARPTLLLFVLEFCLGILLAGVGQYLKDVGGTGTISERCGWDWDKI